MQEIHSSRRKFYYFFVACGFILAAAYVVFAIFQSTNSTAAIGFLFLPFFGGIGAALGGILAFIFFTFKDLITKKNEASMARVLIAIGLVLLGACISVIWTQETSALDLAKNQNTSSDELKLLSDRHFFLRRNAIEEALASHPSSPLLVLEKFVRAPEPRLLNLVGGNPGISVELLTEIASGPLTYDRVAGAAKNPKLNSASIVRLANIGPENFPSKVEYSLYQTFVLAALARRQDIPQDVLDRLAAWKAPEHFLVVALLSSPRVSCSQVKRFLEIESQVLANMAKNEWEKRKCRKSD